LLETLAGSGLLGALALFGMLGAAGVAAARVAVNRAEPGRAEAAAVLAVLVATVTHGLVDCLIGFTGTYLLVAFLVGSAAVPEPARARMREPEQERGAA
jgi:O-antigen ligase